MALKIDHDVKVHADAGHSFMNDHRDEHTPWVFAIGVGASRQSRAASP
jgi:hypothetical protein